MRFVVVGVGAGILTEFLVAARVLQDLEKRLISIIARRISTGGDHRGAQADGILHADGDRSAFIDVGFQVNAAVGNEQQHEQHDPEGHDGIKTETFVFHKAFSFGGPHSWAARDLQRVRFHYSAGTRRMSTVLQMLLRRKSACGAGGRVEGRDQLGDVCRLYCGGVNMVFREYFSTRADGVKLYRTYSDIGMMIKQVETGILYEEAVDMEDAEYSYEETDVKIEREEVDGSE